MADVPYVTEVFFRLAAAGCLIAPLCLSPAHAALVCEPPIAPFLPESDEALKEYADLINQDFERYFTEMSQYTACLDQARADLLVEAQEVSRLHSEFRARADALGVARKAATTVEDPSATPDYIEGIDPGATNYYQGQYND